MMKISMLFTATFSVLAFLPLTTQLNIAVIGSGIGGTSCAYFLKELLQDNATVTLFERDQVGGRLATINVAGDYYESGGSVIHERNKYLSKFAQLLELKRRKDHLGEWGVYNGEEFLIKTSEWSIATFLKLYWRYGYSIVRLNSYLKSLLDDFSRIYQAQEKGLAFTTVQNLMYYMNEKFPNMTQTTITAHLKASGFSELFISELALAVNLVNYGQTDINAFVGAVSLAGSQEGLWSIKDGNKQVPIGLVGKSGAKLLDADVKTITLQADGKFKVFYQHTASKSSATNTFDVVVIASPLMTDQKNIKFQDFPKDISKYEGKYHRTISTFVQGTPKTSAFHTDWLPETVFTNNDSFLFNCLGQSFPVSDEDPKQQVYKIFTKVPLTKSQVNQFFDDVNIVKSKDWFAYPKYEVPESIPPFVLYPGLYYTNAIEWSASAMEMSAIAGRNVALLMYNMWSNNLGKIDEQKITLRDEL